jgi:hypothetical protein
MGNFHKNVVSEVLMGHQSLVDLALVDATNRILFQMRHSLSLASECSREMSLIHSLCIGEIFLSGKGHTNLGKCPGVSLFLDKREEKQQQPFMRIEVLVSTDSKGVVKAYPNWSGGQSFLQELMEKLKIEVESIHQVQLFFRDNLMMLQSGSEQPNMRDLSYGSSLEVFMSTATLVKATDANATTPDILFRDVLLEWDELYRPLFHYNVIQQPKISVKLGLISQEFREGMKQLVSTQNYLIFIEIIIIHNTTHY